MRCQLMRTVPVHVRTLWVLGRYRYRTRTRYTPGSFSPSQRSTRTSPIRPTVIGSAMACSTVQLPSGGRTWVVMDSATPAPCCLTSTTHFFFLPQKGLPVSLSYVDRSRTSITSGSSACQCGFGLLDRTRATTDTATAAAESSAVAIAGPSNDAKKDPSTSHTGMHASRRRQPGVVA